MDGKAGAWQPLPGPGKNGRPKPTKSRLFFVLYPKSVIFEAAKRILAEIKKKQ